MRRHTRSGIVGLILMLSFGLASTASAQQIVANEDLEGIRATIPDGFPGKYDLTEASAEFGELVILFNESTFVEDFGDGSQLTGVCGGWAYSYDENGDILDAAFDIGNNDPPIDLLTGEQAFTSSNPFEVDTRGVVTYYGFSPEDGEGPREHRWFIKTSGISLDRGGDPNPELKNRNVGIVDLAEDLPVKFTAVVRVEGEMTSETQPDCIGKGHVKFIGNGIGDPVGLVGVALLAGGIFGLLFNSRPAFTYKSGGSV